jgi:hypothetical protein
VDIGDKHVTVISVSGFHSKPGLVLDALLRGSDCVTRPRANFCINKKMKDWKVQQHLSDTYKKEEIGGWTIT